MKRFFDNYHKTINKKEYYLNVVFIIKKIDKNKFYDMISNIKMGKINTQVVKQRQVIPKECEMNINVTVY